ncbi:MAG: hypothetical protein JXR25_03615 [Pontiellaceae bacterium]|nr:hypothetical protein [Pontiellaceae bacterium]MBN2783889.1 hypothetical protein [Pontiellaceae bacterium]
MGVNKSAAYGLVALLIAVLCFGIYRLGIQHGRQMVLTGSRGQCAECVGDFVGAGSGQNGSAQIGSGPAPLGNSDAVPVGRIQIESAQKQRLMRNLSENLAMPGMSRMIQGQQRVLMVSQYGDLIETLGLNEEEAGYFVDLLTARQMFNVDMGMKLMTGMLSEEERKELLQRVGEGVNKVNDEIDWFLNNEVDSEYFDYYEQTEGERTLVGSLNDRLSQAGLSLGDGVDKELIAILHEEISDYPFSVQFEEGGSPVFSRFTDGNIAIFIHEMQGLREPVLNEAAAVLSPAQLDVLSYSFGQYIEFYDQRFRMVQQFFNPAQ